MLPVAVRTKFLMRPENQAALFVLQAEPSSERPTRLRAL
jgi:hypothetical protein